MKTKLNTKTTKKNRTRRDTNVYVEFPDPKNANKIRALYYAIVGADLVYVVKDGVDIKVKLGVPRCDAQLLGKHYEHGVIGFNWWDQGIFETNITVWPTGLQTAKKVGDTIEMLDYKGKKFAIKLCKNNPVPMDVNFDVA